MTMTFKDIPISTITVGERFRKDYGDLQSLVSAYKNGKILQPLGVKPVGDGYKLVFGGRRFEAARLAEIDTVTCRILDEMDEYETRMVELSENIDRKSMTPLEKMKLQAEIHRLYTMKYGQGDANHPGHTIKDTAQSLGRTPASIGDDLNVYERVSQLPEGVQELLGTCKTKSDIKKFLKDAERDAKKHTKINEARAKIESEGKGVKQTLLDSFRVEDFLTAEIDQKFQLVEFDPPYAIDIIKLRREHKNSTSIGDSYYTDIEASEYINWMRKALEKCYKLLDDDGWLILWQSTQWLPIFFGMEVGNLHIDEGMKKILKEGILRQIGFSVPRTHGVWDKKRGQTTNPKFVLGSAHELFIYARKGVAEIQQTRNNVFQYAVNDKLHTAQRPMELIKDILLTFGYEGMEVLCPCAGSGMTIISSHLAGMSCVAFDIVQEYKDNFPYLIQKYITT